MNTITENIQRYFAEKLPLTVRYNPTDTGSETDEMGVLIGLPHPYNIPSPADIFQEMYYWDTYFLNTGLILSGDLEQAKNNIDNMCYLIDRYGFMPNGNRSCFLYNSQPPFFAKMIKELYEVTQDKDWLARVYPVLKKENAFWQERRITSCGLNRYSGDYEEMPQRLKNIYADSMRKRVGPEIQLSEEELGRGLLSAGESGWDCNPRMFYETHKYAAVELNSLLYLQESCLAEFAEILSYTDEAAQWNQRMTARAELCRKYLKADDGVFYDYHVANQKLHRMASAACFYPLYCKLATQEEAASIIKLLPKLETDHGIVTCEQTDIPGSFQWGYPNGWAPMQRIVVEGLLNYGYIEDGRRIARKFVNMMERCFEKTGHTWEKYDIVSGTSEATNEYEQLPMTGWNYGTYIYLQSVLE